MSIGGLAQPEWSPCTSTFKILSLAKTDQIGHQQQTKKEELTEEEDKFQTQLHAMRKCLTR